MLEPGSPTQTACRTKRRNWPCVEIVRQETLRLGDAFGICHCGEATEAGRDTCYIKFAKARLGPHAERMFERLLDGCETLAGERGLRRMEAGVNLNRSQVYRQMLTRGFRTDIQGVAIDRLDLPACNRQMFFWRTTGANTQKPCSLSAPRGQALIPVLAKPHPGSRRRAIRLLSYDRVLLLV